jgi:hypothetical protein
MPIATSAGAVEVGASIGLVIVRASSEVPSLARLLRTSDMAMQEQKRLGGGVSLVAYEDGKTEVNPLLGTPQSRAGMPLDHELPAIDDIRSVRLMIGVVAAAALVFAAAAGVAFAGLVR